MVLGATNRPNDIDAAILRRMPKRYAVSLPDAAQRRKILSIMLAGSALDSRFDLADIVRKTEGYSGSDLKELCRAAAMNPVREFLRSEQGRERVGRVAAGQKALAAATASAQANGTAVPNQLITGAAKAGQEKVSTRPIRNSDFFVNDSAATPVGSRMNVANVKAQQAARAAKPVQDGLD